MNGGSRDVITLMAKHPSQQELAQQLALPKAACDKVYATSGYEDSVRNMARTSLDSDMVFADGDASQLGTVTGDAENGMTVTLTVPV